ncbi:MAG: hypothetical protein JSW41_03875 [Candidatus Aenigmatarchaeota archaeon]|nr:MAG: hypothetical protein JSW41_03875 [Candidatus Aenigmarchaeota archaeon]
MSEEESKTFDSRTLILVIMGVAVMVVIIWLMSLKKEEDETDGNGLNGDFPLNGYQPPPPPNGDEPITGVFYDEWDSGSHSYMTDLYWEWGEERLVLTGHADLRPGGGAHSILIIYGYAKDGSRYQLWKGTSRNGKWIPVDLAPQRKLIKFRFHAERGLFEWAGWIDQVKATMTYSKVRS